jgi:hypothetical protein
VFDRDGLVEEGVMEDPEARGGGGGWRAVVRTFQISSCGIGIDV